MCIQIWVAPPGLLLCWAIHTIWYVWYLYTWTCVKAESGDAAHHGISAPKAPKRDFKMPKFRITAISGKDANRSVKASKLDRWLNRFLLFTINVNNFTIISVRDVWSFSYPKFFGSLRLHQRPHRGAISARIDPVHIKKTIKMEHACWFKLNFGSPRGLSQLSYLCMRFVFCDLNRLYCHWIQWEFNIKRRK